MKRFRKNGSAKEKAVRPLDVGRIVRRLREERNLSGVEFCRRGKGIDPKTLVALEKGRIRNPSMATLAALAKGFGITVSDLFRQAELEQRNYFSLGSQKGVCKIDLPSQGIQLISFTPLTEELFCGKMILEGQKRFDEKLLAGGGGAFFVMTLIGQFEGAVEGRKALLKEGDNLYFYGGMKFHLANALQRNSTLLVVAVPSFLKARQVFRKRET
ncbi:MAG TPA: helix-turn-helix transcriptional regulator [Candidatus Omnitrophota bacterium]|nr:helix-turn-helix transcriptional regulator [Candidatus Omnitrophota bacterium]HRY86126.1 helix-turn-helix transcriptional regulator [Candidatus Omnitrophota bacterium]